MPKHHVSRNWIWETVLTAIQQQTGINQILIDADDDLVQIKCDPILVLESMQTSLERKCRVELRITDGNYLIDINTVDDLVAAVIAIISNKKVSITD